MLNKFSSKLRCVLFHLGQTTAMARGTNTCSDFVLLILVGIILPLVFGSEQDFGSKLEGDEIASGDKDPWE